MKGTIFVELLSMAETTWGEDAVDASIARCPLASRGAYTAVGTYPSSELTQLVGEFSQSSGDSIDALHHRFGHWMHAHFVATYPAFYDAHADAFSMLESIEDEVHSEVRKLYPDSELPVLGTERLEPGVLRFTYRSPRKLTLFCRGLIEACIQHYGEQADIVETDRSTPELAIVDFLITRKVS